jgi:uncharacterized membrane protein YcaP (DUF421 family)
MRAYEQIRQVLGLDLEPRDLSFFQISLRGIIVFVVSLVIVRVANKRFLSNMTAFDAILGFILASMLARAVNGSAAFVPTLAAGFVLVGVHRVIARLAYRSDKFGNVVKGTAQTIVSEGKLDRKMMARVGISEKDLLEEARLNGTVTKVEDIQLATLERSGEVSVVGKR